MVITTFKLQVWSVGCHWMDHVSRLLMILLKIIFLHHEWFSGLLHSLSRDCWVFWLAQNNIFWLLLLLWKWDWWWLEFLSHEFEIACYFSNQSLFDFIQTCIYWECYNNLTNGLQNPPSAHIFCIRHIAQNFMRKIKDKRLQKKL